MNKKKLINEIVLFIKFVAGVVTKCSWRSGSGTHDYCKRCNYHANYKGRDICRY